jgi:bifunctional non-homologous end joining protein LigD
VQRHDATRLHYDFRLEIDGVLKSWAVPKGPTLDPSVEAFRGSRGGPPRRIRRLRGQHSGRQLRRRQRDAVGPRDFRTAGRRVGAEQIARGDLKFRLHGEKLNGDFALVHMKGRGKGNDWLIIKKRDQFATPGWDVEAHATSVLSGRTQEEIAQNLPARKSQAQDGGRGGPRLEEQPPGAGARQGGRTREGSAGPEASCSGLEEKARAQADMPAALEPMTATLADQPPRGSDWLFEVKWDGVRAIRFRERGNPPHVAQRHALRAAVSRAGGHPPPGGRQAAVLDGEIAVLDAKGVSQFHLIQPRISNADPNSVAHLARSRRWSISSSTCSTWMATTCAAPA